MTASARVLQTLGATDASLLTRALERAHDLALLGDRPFSQLRVDDSSLPHESFPALVLSLCGALRTAAAQDPEWMSALLSKALGRLMMTTAMLLVLRGEEVPLPPEEVLVDVSGRRRLPENGAPSTELFIWTAHQIADLPQGAYDATMKGIEFYLGIHDVTVEGSSETLSTDVADIIRRWALWTTSYAVTWLTVASEQEASTARRGIESIVVLGRRAAEQSRLYVAKERSLLEGESARIAGTEVRVKCSAGTPP